MKDVFGREVNVGDKVIYVRNCKTSTSYYPREILKVNEQSVTIEQPYWKDRTCNVTQIIKISEEEYQELIK